MKLYRRIALAAFALLIAGAIVYAYLPRPVQVSVTRVSRGFMDVSVEEDGRTRVRERYVVTAPVPAYAPRLPWDVGDSVRAHETLAMLSPLPPGALDVRTRAQAEARVAQARAALRAAETNADAAQADADFAAREQARLRKLRASGVMSQAALDQAETEAHRAAAMLASARSAIDVARYDLSAAVAALRFTAGAQAATEKVPLFSPVDGAVLSIEHQDEGAVAAGQPLLTVGNPHSLEVSVDVLSSDAVRLHPGGRVVFTQWGGEAPLKGRVRNVEPVAFTKVSSLGVEEQRVLVIVDFASPEKDWLALGDGYRLEARFIIWESKDALRVPVSALFRSGADWAVLLVKDGRIMRQPVRLGERGELYGQVLGGLSAGEVVVTYPDDSLKEGERADIVQTSND